MKKVYLFAAMASLVLAGCSNKDEVKNPNELSVVAGIGSSSTRALVTTSSFADASKIALFVGGSDGYTPVLTTYTLSGTTWGTSTPIYLTGKTANVYGYYPYDASNSGITDANTTITASIYSTGTAIAPTETSFTGAGQTDYMWANPASATNLDPIANSNVVTLAFNHALSRISFVINKDANYPTAAGSGKITSIKLTNGGTPFTTVGSFKVSDGTFTATTSSATSIEFTPVATPITYINEYNATPIKETACGLVAPTTTALSVIGLQMTIDGKVMTATNFPAAPVWLSGNSYTYTVTVSPTALKVSSTVTVALWTPGTPVTGITAQ